MAADRTLDLVCVSYLASTQLLRVPEYPSADGGAVVDHIASSIGADGPLAAITAARLGLRVGLVANAVGVDPAGHVLLDWLAAVQVRHTIGVAPDTATPQLTVVVDGHGTRTWFASLHDAPAQLYAANLHLLADARLIYVDCYQVLTRAAVRAIAAAGPVPLLLNLGGDPLQPAVLAATAGRHVATVQTSLDEADAGNAESLATELFDRLHPHAAVVTLGRLGAVARTSAGLHQAPAPPVAVMHTHGAGAAFSAGYAHALLAGADTDRALRAGCEAGAKHCTSPAAAVPSCLPAATFAAA